MWQRLMEVLPDWPWWDSLARSEQITITDIGFNVLTLFVTIVAAGFAIRLAYRQTAMMREQTAISKRLEAIAIRQGEIAETQHHIMQAQLGKQAVLSVKLVLTKREPNVRGFTVSIVNSGNKASYGCYWYVIIPAEREEEVMFQAAGTPTPQLGSIDGINHLYFQGHSDKPLFPGRSDNFGTIDVLLKKMAGPLEVKWHLVGEEGPFPKGKEYETIRISGSGDVTG